MLVGLLCNSEAVPGTNPCLDALVIALLSYRLIVSALRIPSVDSQSTLSIVIIDVIYLK